MSQVQSNESTASETATRAVNKSMSDTRRKLIKAKAYQIAMKGRKIGGVYIRSK
jgi:hypothetical protein